MATSDAALHMLMARSLPLRLQKFFALNPPKQFIPGSSPANASSSTARDVPTLSALHMFKDKPNPFMPHKNHKTGRWNPPLYSLRRQADLAKLAEAHGVDELLPFTTKSFAYRNKRRQEEGLRIKGTGVGQRVKGHHHERTLKSRLEKRRKAMLAMPQMIQDWKQRGHGRGWKKWPSK